MWGCRGPLACPIAVQKFGQNLDAATADERRKIRSISMQNSIHTATRCTGIIAHLNSRLCRQQNDGLAHGSNKLKARLKPFLDVPFFGFSLAYRCFSNASKLPIRVARKNMSFRSHANSASNVSCHYPLRMSTFTSTTATPTPTPTTTIIKTAIATRTAIH